MANPQFVKGQQPPTGRQFSKDNPATNPGRKPKIYTKISKGGYSLDDIKACSEEVFFMTEALLQKHADDESNPAILRLMARGMLDDLKSGKIDKMLGILNRILPLPSPTVNQQINIGANSDGVREMVVVRRVWERHLTDGSAEEQMAELPADYSDTVAEIEAQGNDSDEA